MKRSMGGRYCSMTTVDLGNAFVLELSTAKTATAEDLLRLMSMTCVLESHSL